MATLSVLPVVARSASLEAWAALGVGQAIGGVLTPVVGYGWSLVGPVRAARLIDENEIFDLLLESIKVRLFMALFALIAACGAALFIVPRPQALLCVMMSVAVLSGGIAPTWLAVGLGKPRLVLIYEVAPRALAAVVSAGAILSGVGVWIYPTTLVLASLMGTLVQVFVRRQRCAVQRRPASKLFALLRRDARAMSTLSVAAFYANSAVIVLSIVSSPQAVAIYSSSERLYRLVVVAVGSLNNALQGWVSMLPASEAIPRMQRSVFVHALLGALGSVGFAVAVPPVSRMLFGSELGVPRSVAVGMALAVLFVALNSSLSRHVLIPWGNESAPLLATCVGALVGVPLLAWGGSTWGALGVAVAFAVSEGVVALICAIAIFRCAPIWRARAGSALSSVDT